MRALLLLASVLVPAALPQDGGTLEGHVVSSGTHAPLNGVAVTARQLFEPTAS